MTSKLRTLSAVPSCHYAGGRSPTHHSCLDSALRHHTPELWEHNLQCCTGTGPANSLHIQEENFVFHKSFKTVVSIYIMWFNIKNICILLTWCIYIFCMILTVNNDYFLQLIYCAALYWIDTVFIEKLRWGWRKFQNVSTVLFHGHGIV